jgi:hypothetical protein
MFRIRRGSESITPNKRINFFSHTLQLAVHKTLRDKNIAIYSSALEKAKVISAKFSKSVKAKEKLKECGGIAVKTYCRTRWFSELHLVDSLLENHQRPGDPVAQVLAFLQCEELVPTPVVSKKKASRIFFSQCCGIWSD